MSDKEVIIDNIDVSECENFEVDEEKIYWCCDNDNLCEEVKNCYYKQLQRLNIIHKNTIETYKKEIKDLKLKIRKLKKNLKEGTNENKKRNITKN